MSIKQLKSSERNQQINIVNQHLLAFAQQIINMITNDKNILNHPWFYELGGPSQQILSSYIEFCY